MGGTTLRRVGRRWKVTAVPAAMLIGLATSGGPAFAGPDERLLVTKSADVATVSEGGRITYTIVVRNRSGHTLTGITATEDISGLLDDATYSGGATGPGLVASASTLRWTFPLAAGESVQLGYSVTAKAGGDRRAASALRVWTPIIGETRPCLTVVRVVQDGPDLAVVKNVDQAVAGIRSVVAYRIDVVNRGNQLGPVTLTDDLTDVIDDATYTNNATASSGAAPVYTRPKLTWQGTLAPGATVTIRYSVRTPRSLSGPSKVLNNAVTVPGSNCAAGTAPECRTRVPIASVRTTLIGRPGNRQPAGRVIPMIVEVTNDGAFDLVGNYAPTVSNDLTGVLDDATYHNDARGPGTITFSPPTLAFTVDLPAGQKATWTYSVTAKDGGNGDYSDSMTSRFSLPTGAPVRVPPHADTAGAGSATNSCTADLAARPLPVTGPSGGRLALLVGTGLASLLLGIAALVVTRRRAG